MIQLADVCAFVVNRYLQLKCYGSGERYDGELAKITDWYRLIGDNIVSHSAFDPSGKDGLRAYYCGLRPENWSGKAWEID